ncbi:MAG: ArsA family ATPase [Thermodesulfobacteriota bacterium]|nr:ArsA family ATPase [Thermodesulfobacteriota bacterium]
MNKPANLFFMGKGGVGKSTSSALYSVYLAEKGFKVLMVSLDPAHNQCDIFKKSFSDKPMKVMNAFSVIEVEQEKWIKTYLKGIQQQINRTYSYLTAFNLENYFKVIKHSPGLEEYALILAFNHIQNNFSDNDYLIFDMAPTALSLKFFNLPVLSLIWIDHLLALRQEIIKKREIITKIKLIKKEFERDKVLNKINEMKNEFQTLKKIFEHRDKTKVQLVLNPDQLSFAESLRIFEGLKDINIHVNQIVYNKKQMDSAGNELNKELSEIPMINFPYSETPLIGYDVLKQYLKNSDNLVEKQLERVLMAS